MYDHPFYVILNFAVGEAGFPGTVDATTPKVPAISGRVVNMLRLYESKRAPRDGFGMRACHLHDAVRPQ